MLTEGAQASVSTGTGLEPSVGASWLVVPAPGWVLGLLSPVLKHGPRSLTCVRVLGVNPPARNKRKGEFIPLGRILRCTIDRP